MAQPSCISLQIKKTVISLAIAALGFTASSSALAYQKVHQPDNSYQQYISAPNGRYVDPRCIRGI